ncbi:methyltransferase domain-containing protein [Peziza echinospora]|nr:methyltransferase domain-containing protein [Peziza echinospora]
MIRIKDHAWKLCSLFLLLFIIFQQSASPPTRGAYWPASIVCPESENSAHHFTLKSKLLQYEQIYQETLQQRHEIISKYEDPSTIPFFAAIDGPTYTSTPYSIWDLIPASFNCPHDMQRIGRMGDGGKWVCGITRLPSPSLTSSSKYNNAENCTIYSFGVRDESSFEEEMLKRTGCRIWAYDPAVSSFGPQLSESYIRQNRAYFTRAALAPKTSASQNPPSYSLKDLMDMNSHSHIDILKIDIEFAEFSSLDAFMNDFARKELPVGQILIEIHLFKDRITPKEFLDWWEKLENHGFRPVWTEPNLLYVTQHISDGMPRLSEYTLINTKSAASRIMN